MCLSLVDDLFPPFCRPTISTIKVCSCACTCTTSCGASKERSLAALQLATCNHQYQPNHRRLRPPFGFSLSIVRQRSPDRSAEHNKHPHKVPECSFKRPRIQSTKSAISIMRSLIAATVALAAAPFTNGEDLQSVRSCSTQYLT